MYCTERAGLLVDLQVRFWCDQGSLANQTTENRTTEAMRWPSSRGLLPDGAQTLAATSTSTTPAPVDDGAENGTTWTAEVFPTPGVAPDPRLVILVVVLVAALGLSVRVVHRQRQRRGATRRRDQQLQLRWSLFQRSTRPARPATRHGQPGSPNGYLTPPLDASEDSDAASFHSVCEEKEGRLGVPAEIPETPVLLTPGSQ
jgi:hypothetical protein